MNGPNDGGQSIHTVRATLVGRERELTLLQAELARTLTGQGGVVLISGEAGIGKTSLVRAICQHAADGQVTVHTGACYDLSVTPPYGPWIEIFAEIGGDISLPPLPVDPAEQSPRWTTSQDAFFAEAMDALSGAAESRARVLVLEDLHWSDTASLEFLRYAARQIGDVPVLVIGTYRDTEIDRQHPLHLHLPALVRESNTIRISLLPLDESSIDRMLREHYQFGAPERARLRAYLKRRAEGNPFFIGEILRSLEENGVIRLQDGSWTLGDLGSTPVPTLVRRVIDNRLAQIDPVHRNLLAIAATIGQDIDIDIWQQVSQADDAQLATTIRDATRLNVLEEAVTSGAMQFTHALIREALYREIPLPERRSLHRAIAEAHQHLLSTDPDAIAYHYTQAQDERAPEWLMLAGERAQQLYAWRTAAERFAAVLEIIGNRQSLRRAAGWLSYRIGLLLTYADSENGIERMLEAEQIADEVGDPQLRAFARTERGLLRCLTGDVRRGLAELRSGVALIDELGPADLPTDDDSAETRERLSVSAIRRGTFQLISTADEINVRHGPLVFWLAWAGRYADALEIGEPFVERASQIESNVQDALGDALAGLGHAFAARGQPEQSLRAFAKARDAFGSIDHHFKVGNTAIYELSEAFLPYRADRVMERQWLADQAEAG